MRTERTARPARPGVVYLVGAGPGDPELLTLRARALLEAADVVLYDRLVDPAVLGWCRAGTVRAFVGKRAGRHSVPQAGIEAALVRWAREGKVVVRLKGGDPLVFGRGGEEAERLAREGIRFEIVPGVTAALGAAAYAGIPLTHRRHTSTVTFVTGHEDVAGHAPRVPLRALARAGGTLCIYMGVGRLATIVRELRTGGLPARTPVAVIERAATARQRTVRCTLGTVVARTGAAGVESPALVVVGEVAAFADQLAWFTRPLADSLPPAARGARRAAVRAVAVRGGR